MSASDLSEIELYRDDSTGRIVAVDPATGDRYPVPLEQLSVGGEGPITGVAPGATDADGRLQGGSGGGEWEEDGNGNIVPTDGETVGDGNTDADLESASIEETVAGQFDADAMVHADGRPETDRSLDGLTRIPAANILAVGITPTNGDETFEIPEQRTCRIEASVRVDDLNQDDRLEIRFQAVDALSGGAGPVLAQNRTTAFSDPVGELTWIECLQKSTIPSDYTYEWVIENRTEPTRGTIKTGNQNTMVLVEENMVGGFNKPTRS